MNKVSTEQKLRLIQDIRQQHQYNRMKCREREQFLYGNSLSEMQRGELYSTEVSSLQGELGGACPYKEDRGKVSGFKIRLLLAALLLGSFVIWDYSSTVISDMTAETFYEMLTETMELPSAFAEQINRFPDTSRR